MIFFLKAANDNNGFILNENPISNNEYESLMYNVTNIYVSFLTGQMNVVLDKSDYFNNKQMGVAIGMKIWDTAVTLGYSANKGPFGLISTPYDGYSMHSLLSFNNFDARLSLETQNALDIERGEYYFQGNLITRYNAGNYLISIESQGQKGRFSFDNKYRQYINKVSITRTLSKNIMIIARGKNLRSYFRGTTARP